MLTEVALTGRPSGRQQGPWLRHFYGPCWCPPLAALLPAPLTLGVSYMTETHESCRCADCGASIDLSNTAPYARTPCNACGSIKRVLHVNVIEKIQAIDGYALKGKRPGRKKPFIEERSLPDYSRSRDKFVHLQRTIDRDNDLYSEKVTDYQTGELIHKCEEPLSQHQGHGSAKHQKPKV